MEGEGRGGAAAGMLRWMDVVGHTSEVFHFQYMYIVYLWGQQLCMQAPLPPYASNKGLLRAQRLSTGLGYPAYDSWVLVRSISKPV